MAFYTNGAAPTIAAYTNGNGHKNGGAKKARRPRRQFTRNGERFAVLHAFLAARAYVAKWYSTLEAAATAAGVSVRYVRAALVLLEAGNETLISHVMRGNVSILAAAAEIGPLVQMMAGYHKASAAVLKAFEAATGMYADLGEHILHSSAEKLESASRKATPTLIWERMVVPGIEMPTATPTTMATTENGEADDESADWWVELMTGEAARPANGQG